MTGDVYEFRRRNLTELLKETGAKTALAVKLDMTQPQISHWLRDPKAPTSRPIKEDSARQIERAIGLSPGDLDRDPDAPARPPRSATSVNIELLTETTRAVLTEVGAAKGKQMIDKVSDIVSLAYEHAVTRGSVDANYVHQLVKLMH
jgi:hypothetical protein